MRILKYVLYYIINYYLLHVLSIKYSYLHTVNNIVVSLCVSQGVGHFDTQLPRYVI